MERVAVYGSLRKGLGLHRVLSEAMERGQARFLGEVWLEGWIMRSATAYPYAYRTGEGCILVEVYEVERHILAHLDVIEGHPWHYRRVAVETAHGQTWIYEGADGARPNAHNLPLVPGGDWVRFRDFKAYSQP